MPCHHGRLPHIMVAFWPYTLTSFLLTGALLPHCCKCNYFTQHGSGPVASFRSVSCHIANESLHQVLDQALCCSAVTTGA